jgi:uncharacterized protein YuzE
MARYLEVTYRHGKPFAAYLHLDRQTADKAARSERREDCIIDYSDDGRLIGIEFTRMSGVDLHAVNRILAEAQRVTGGGGSGTIVSGVTR